mmetsp:Transcript_3060/g.6230  ORF Transcript_3060/g.6230 Transcript_3060/m.6230 type:complete len:266 (-) Transcript_3060:174-971(-)
MEETPLGLDAFREGLLVSSLYRLLACREHGDGVSRDLSGDAEGRGKKFFRREHSCNETQPLRLMRIDGFPTQAHQHCVALADCLRQSLSPPSAWDQTEFDLRLSKLCLLRGQNDVAHHRNLTPASEGHTVDRSDHRNLHVRQYAFPLRDRVIPTHRQHSLGVQLGDIRSCSKCFAPSCQDDARNFGVLRQVKQGIVQRSDDAVVQSIQGLGPVQRHDRDSPFVSRLHLHKVLVEGDTSRSGNMTTHDIESLHCGYVCAWRVRENS